MTLITLQDGKVVLRDGKVGTEQACCCGDECDEVVLSCFTSGNDIGGTNTDGPPEGWQGEVAAYFAAQGLVALLQANGYTGVRGEAGGIAVDEFGTWATSYTLVACCSGEIDFEAEPIWEGTDDFFDPGVPSDISGFACFANDLLFPCNPLP